MNWNEQDFLQEAYRFNPQLDKNWSVVREGPPDATRPSQYTYSLQGPQNQLLPQPVPFTPLPPVKDYYAQAPMQQGGLQSLPQGMGQGFGMQSPRPFGTQQPFSSGFGGFGQQLLPNFNTYSDIRVANSYNPAMGIK